MNGKLRLALAIMFLQPYEGVNSKMWKDKPAALGFGDKNHVGALSKERPEFA